MNLAEILNIVATIIALIVAVVGHEIMHGLVALKYGDDTAKNEGRLSINPIKHIDLVGTIIVPALLYISNAGFIFGWAKPVPVNIRKVILNGGENGAIAVSLAGIAYNLLLALISSILISFFNEANSLFFLLLLTQLVFINIVLAVFNLWPIPPLDGANALMHIASKFKFYKVVDFYQKIFPYGMIILIIVLITPIKIYFFMPIYYILILLSFLSNVDLIALIDIVKRI